MYVLPQHLVQFLDNCDINTLENILNEIEKKKIRLDLTTEHKQYIKDEIQKRIDSLMLEFNNE